MVTRRQGMFRAVVLAAMVSAAAVGSSDAAREGVRGGPSPGFEPGAPTLNLGHATLHGRKLVVTVKCSSPDCLGDVRPLFLAELSERGRKVPLGLRAKSFSLAGGRTSTRITWRLARK